MSHLSNSALPWEFSKNICDFVTFPGQPGAQFGRSWSSTRCKILCLPLAAQALKYYFITSRGTSSSIRTQPPSQSTTTTLKVPSFSCQSRTPLPAISSASSHPAAIPAIPMPDNWWALPSFRLLAAKASSHLISGSSYGSLDTKYLQNLENILPSTSPSTLFCAYFLIGLWAN